jgi:hypothetical protein
MWVGGASLWLLSGTSRWEKEGKAGDSGHDAGEGWGWLGSKPPVKLEWLLGNST